MRNYKKLQIWWKAHHLFLHVRCSVTILFPADERYVLTSQTARAALSIPLDISEGAGRSSDKDFAHFLDQALGSTNELENCCLAAYELSYISEQLHHITGEMISELRAMLISFLQHLRQKE